MPKGGGGRRRGAMKVQEVMQEQVKTVRVDTSLKDAAGLLAEHGISGLPVVNGDGEVLGVVSEADILVKTHGPRPERGTVFERLLGPVDPKLAAKTQALTAGEAMTAPAVTIRRDAQVSEAAGLMAKLGINRLPVVEQGRLVGILTRADVVRAFIRADDAIAAEIGEDVVGRVFWLSPDRVQVGVEDGKVTLDGELDHESIATLLAEHVRRVPGVVSVDSRLRWKVGS
jgi:CBS domain-containing protein